MNKKLSRIVFLGTMGLFVFGGAAIFTACASKQPVEVNEVAVAEEKPVYTALQLMQQSDYEEARERFKPKEDINLQEDETGDTVLHIAARRNLGELCTYFLLKDADVSIRNNSNETPLFTAIAENAYTAAAAIVKVQPEALFQKYSVDGDNEKGTTALMTGSRKSPGFYDAFVVDATKDVVDENGDDILHYFVKNQDLNGVKHCIAKGFFLSSINYDGKTPLELAFDNIDLGNSVDIAAALIEGGADEVDTIYNYFQDAVANRNLSTRFEDGQTPLHLAAIQGHNTVAKYLISNSANTAAQDSSGATPLHEAIRYGNLDVARQLLMAGANVNATDNLGKTPIMIFPQQDKIIDAYRLLIAYNADINQKDMFGDTVIHNATMMSVDTQVISLLVSSGGDINARNKEGVTPLEIAVQKEDIGTVKLLTENGADIHTKDKDGKSPLSLSMDGSTEMFEAVLNSKNATSQDSEGNTPLHTALLVNAPFNKIQYIIMLTDDVNVRNREGNSVLYLATMANNRAVGELLLSKNADIFSANTKNDSPLRIALRKGGSIMDWMITSQTISAADGSGNTALHYAAEWKYKNAINSLLLKGADIHARNANGETPLFNATKSNNPDVIQVIVDGGADVQARDNLGNTAIHIAVRHNSLESIEKLIELGVNVDAQNTAGKSPLSEAVIGGHIEMAKKLLEVGADSNSCDTDGVTVLVDAIKIANLEMVELLLENEANPQIQDINGRNAYHEAAILGNKDIIAQIREHGGNPLARDRQGNTPFSLVLKKDIDIVKEVLGSSKNITDSDGNTPIHIVVKSKASRNLLKTLVTEKYPIDTRNSDGYTALNLAIEANDVDTAKILLESGANPFQMIDKKGRNGVRIALEKNNPTMISNIVRYAGSRSDVQGNTILHYAAQNSTAGVVKSLLDAGLNKNVKNVAGETPYTLAVRWKKTENAALLK